MLLSVFLFLFPFVSVASNSKPTCIASGDEKPINQALMRGGKGAIVTLCQGSTHRIHSPIMFTTSRQTLTTEGNPKDRERAMLVVEGEDQAVAVKADCQGCSFAVVRSLIVDGNRPLLSRIPKGGALLELGNSAGQMVRDCRLYEPRGWSALHLREGDMKQCRNAHIVNNDIGPCGEEWDDEYDGMVEIEPLHGNPRADGISLACKDSLVEQNTVTDATDGAIVLFGSAGTEVKDNHVHSRTRVILGGINLVDYEPWRGEYSDVSVHHNTIYAHAGFIKVGIVIGPSSWSDDTESVVSRGSVTDNTFEGHRFGYAIVVSSAEDFIVLRNTVKDNTAFAGVPGPRCPKAPENGPPTAFLINRGSAKGTFQDDFTNGEVQHIICINPPDDKGVAYKPLRFRPFEIDAQLDPATAFDSRLAEAVVSYQMRLLTAMKGINDRIERHNRPRESDDSERPVSSPQDGTQGKGRSKTGITEVDALMRKLDILESGEKHLHKEMEVIQREMGELSRKVKKSADGNRPVLGDVYNNVVKLRATSPSSANTKIDEKSNNRESQSLAASNQGSFHNIVHTSTVDMFGSMFVLVGCGAVFAVAWSVVKRFKSSRLDTKKGKVF